MARKITSGTDFITSANNFDILSNSVLTISMWVINLPGSSPGSYGVFFEIGKSGAYSLFLGLSGTGPKLSAYSAGGLIVDPSTTGLSSNTWTNVILSYPGSGTTWKLYVGGVLQTISGGDTITAQTATKLYIGHSLNNAACTGYAFADFAIWGVQLTDAEASALAAGARPSRVRPQSLVWYPLDGIESSEPDLSGNANNATLTGTALAFSGPPVMQFTPRWPQFIPSAVVVAAPFSQGDWYNPAKQILLPKDFAVQNISLPPPILWAQSVM